METKQNCHAVASRLSLQPFNTGIVLTMLAGGLKKKSLWIFAIRDKSSCDFFFSGGFHDILRNQLSPQDIA